MNQINSKHQCCELSHPESVTAQPTIRAAWSWFYASIENITANILVHFMITKVDMLKLLETDSSPPL